MSEAYSDLAQEPRLLLLPEVDKMLNDCLDPEVIYENQIGQKRASLLARYIGVAVEALSKDNSQNGINGVVDFFTDASAEATKANKKNDQDLLITAHDIAMRYKPSKFVVENLLAQELRVCWLDYASLTANSLLGRNLYEHEILSILSVSH